MLKKNISISLLIFFAHSLQAAENNFDFFKSLPHDIQSKIVVYVDDQDIETKICKNIGTPLTNLIENDDISSPNQEEKVCGTIDYTIMIWNANKLEKIKSWCGKGYPLPKGYLFKYKNGSTCRKSLSPIELLLIFKSKAEKEN